MIEPAGLDLREGVDRRQNPLTRTATPGCFVCDGSDYEAPWRRIGHKPRQNVAGVAIIRHPLAGQLQRDWHREQLFPVVGGLAARGNV